MEDSTTPAVPTNRKWRRLWTQLVDAPIGTERTVFAQYCRGILLLVEQEAISRQIAVLSIAKVYGIARYDDSGQMEEVMQLALQLENPASLTDESWHQLEVLIDGLASAT